jgi:HSP20 family molecular chaperone IbpA
MSESESRDLSRPEESQSMIPSPAVPSASDAASVEPRLLFNPPIDIYETPDGLVLYADLPGVTAEGLDLQVQDSRLTLFGRIQRKDGVPLSLLHQEYQVGDFLRSFILSDEVDHDKIQAKLTNGVLRVELPRAARAKPRRIEVSPG